MASFWSPLLGGLRYLELDSNSTCKPAMTVSTRPLFNWPYEWVISTVMEPVITTSDLQVDSGTWQSSSMSTSPQRLRKRRCNPPGTRASSLKPGSLASIYATNTEQYVLRISNNTCICACVYVHICIWGKQCMFVCVRASSRVYTYIYIHF